MIVAGCVNQLQMTSKKLTELLQKLPEARTRTEKQELSAKIVALMPEFIKELGDAEQKYQKALRGGVNLEGSKSAAELLVHETDVYKVFKALKRLYEAVQSALPVLNMYTKEG